MDTLVANFAAKMNSEFNKKTSDIANMVTKLVEDKLKEHTRTHSEDPLSNQQGIDEDKNDDTETKEAPTSTLEQTDKAALDQIREATSDGAGTTPSSHSASVKFVPHHASQAPTASADVFAPVDVPTNVPYCQLTSEQRYALAQKSRGEEGVSRARTSAVNCPYDRYATPNQQDNTSLRNDQ